MNAKIGLALSGGGARGFAHVGVLSILEENNIQIDCISGVSMGGITAAAYASGFSPKDIETEIIRMTRLSELIKLIDIHPPRRGLLEGNHVKTYLSKLLNEKKSFEDLNIPIALTAVDLISGELISFTHGDLLPAVYGTMCVPGVFTPIEYMNYRLVDGGVLNNLPIKQAESLGADFVIAVNVDIDPQENPDWLHSVPKTDFPLPSFLLDVYRAESLMIQKLTSIHLERHPPDILIKPDIPAEITSFAGFTKSDEIIKAGKRAARKSIPEILQSLKRIIKY